MKNRLVTCSLVVTAVAALSLVFVSTGAAQRGAGAPAAATAKPTPRLPSGHPNLSGFYINFTAGIPAYGSDPIGEAGNLYKQPDGSVLFLYGGANEGLPNADAGNPKQNDNQPPYKPEYMAKAQAIAATVYGSISNLDPNLDCKPGGVPRVGISNMQVVANDNFIALMYENAPGPVYRIIYTDGRTHPKDLDTSYMGHSIGHWEGDTLVVDTVGLNDETWYTQAGGGNAFTSIHSDKEHVIERLTRTGDDLAYQATVEDPVMLTRPWVLPTSHNQIGPVADYIQPQMCNTNDKAHIIRPSDTDKFECNWCQKDEDAVYGKGAAAEREKIHADNPGNPGRPAGGGGGE